MTTITWSTNGKIWLAVYGNYWAKIEEMGTVCKDEPFMATVGTIFTRCNGAEISTTDFDSGVWRETLEKAQAWVAKKLLVATCRSEESPS